MTETERQSAPETTEHSERTELEPVDCSITAHHSSPERTVFVEQDNKDGWIATDHTVELVR